MLFIIIYLTAFAIVLILSYKHVRFTIRNVSILSIMSTIISLFIQMSLILVAKKETYSQSISYSLDNVGGLYLHKDTIDGRDVFKCHYTGFDGFCKTVGVDIDGIITDDSAEYPTIHFKRTLERRLLFGISITNRLLDNTTIVYLPPTTQIHRSLFETSMGKSR